MTNQLKVESAAVDALIPYSRNANIHSDEQIEQIAKSIQEFGFIDPIGVWTNAEGQPEIVEGHGRVLAAKLLGMEAVPVIYLDELTDEQRRAYTHVHNQLTRNSEFDFDILTADLQDLTDFDWDDLGFDTIQLYEHSAGGEFNDGEDAEEKAAIQAYSERAEDEDLKSKNIIISCMSDDEVIGVKELLGVDDRDLRTRFYRAEELL